jgi:hypothetical protein
MGRWGRAALGLVFLLAACGSAPSPATGPSSMTSPAKPVVRVTDPGASRVPPAPKTSVAPSSRSAGPVGGVYDTSSQARSDFLAWWNYEVQVSQDSSRPADEVYQAGVGVCEQRQLGMESDQIQKMIVDDRGYTGSGASGVYKSALEALCQSFNLGYKTDFDRNVDLAYNAITARVTYTPAPFPTYDFGFFMKEACAFMVSIPNAGGAVYEHMRGSTQLALVEGGNVDEVVLRIYIKESVNAGCTIMNEQLPPIIQLA